MRRFLVNAEWTDQAECAKPGYDPEDWVFEESRAGGVGRGHKYAAREKRAKAICGRCPVRQECLRASFSVAPTLEIRDGQPYTRRWAFPRPEPGIWGGMTGRERRTAWKRSQRNLIETLAMLNARWDRQQMGLMGWTTERTGQWTTQTPFWNG